MDANLYMTILENYLLPFIHPSFHQFMQDNDPKHTSCRAKEFFEQHNVNWWKTPPESPDANPIENLWHELKVRSYVILFLFIVILFYCALSMFFHRNLFEGKLNPLTKNSLLMEFVNFGTRFPWQNAESTFLT